MAYNSFATNDANAVKYWSRRLEVETAKALEISRLMGEGEDSIIQVQSELTKDTGDKVTFDLLMQLTGDGFTENETMEGSEESFTFYPDSLLINELHNSVRFPARANINRISFLTDKIRAAVRRHSPPGGKERTRLCSIGCGPAREVVEYLAETETPAVGVRWTLIDQEERALSVAYHDVLRAIDARHADCTAQCLYLSFEQLIRDPLAVRERVSFRPLPYVHHHAGPYG